MASITGLASNVVYRGAQYNNRAYVWNGRNRMRKYDGEAWNFAGIEEADFTPTVATQGTGLSGTYKYLVVPVNSTHVTYGGRVVAGQPHTSATITVNNQGVRVAGIPATADDSQVDEWWIYRNRNGFFDVNVEDEIQDFFKVAEITVGTTQYDDADGAVVADSALPPIVTSHRHNIPPTFKYGSIYGERLFGCGFDPITDGTATKNGSNADEIDFSGVSLPDGVLGCFFQADGDATVYTIIDNPSTTKIQLDADYSGSLSGAGYSIFRDRSQVWFSEYRDPDAWGLDGENFRNRLTVGGPNSKLQVTGIFPFRGSLYVFTKTQIYKINGAGPDQRSIKITPDPVFDGLGAVSGDAITAVDNLMYFLTMRGPAVYDGFSAPRLIGDKLGFDWLDDLDASELAKSNARTAGRLVRFSVVQSSDTEPSLTYTYDIDTGTWWPEDGTFPNVVLSLDEDSDGKPASFYGQGKYLVQDDVGTNDGLPSGESATGIVDSTTTTTITDTSQSWTTTNRGLDECMVHIFNPTTLALVGSRRITSNTSDTLTWSSTSGDGGGTLSVPANAVYHIAPVYMRYRTKNHLVSSRQKRDMRVHLDFDLVKDDGTDREGTASNLHLTEYVDDKADSNVKVFAVDEAEKDLLVNVKNNTYGIKIESRETDADIAIRSILLNPNVKETQK